MTQKGRATVLYLKISVIIKIKDNHINPINRHMRFFFHENKHITNNLIVAIITFIYNP